MLESSRTDDRYAHAGFVHPLLIMLHPCWRSARPSASSGKDAAPLVFESAFFCGGATSSRIFGVELTKFIVKKFFILTKLFFCTKLLLSLIRMESGCCLRFVQSLQRVSPNVHDSFHECYAMRMSDKALFFACMLMSAMPSWGQRVTLTGQIKNAFTRQAIPGVRVTLMRADSTIIEDSLMEMALDGYTLWVSIACLQQERVSHGGFRQFDTAPHGFCSRPV